MALLWFSICSTILFILPSEVRSEMSVQVAYTLLDSRILKLEIDAITLQTSMNNLNDKVQTLIDHLSTNKNSENNGGSLKTGKAGNNIMGTSQMKKTLQRAFVSEKISIRNAFNSYGKQFTELRLAVNDQLSLMNRSIEVINESCERATMKTDDNLIKTLHQFKTHNDKRLEGSFSRLETQINNTSTELKLAVSEQNSLRDSVKNIASVQDRQDKEMESMRRKMKSMEDTRVAQADVVGFTAELSSTLIDLPVNSVVLFDQVEYNAGSGYNPATGIFTCPRSGMYVFAIFVSSYTTEIALIRLMIDGGGKIAAVSEPHVSSQDSTGGNVLVWHLMEGDRVWVKTQIVNNQDLYASFTTFSGFLIQST